MPWATVLTIAVLCTAPAAALAFVRWRARARRTYVRLAISPYRTDQADEGALVELFEVLHKRLLARWWRRIASGQVSLALEAHVLPGAGGVLEARLALCCQAGSQALIRAAIRGAYPNAQIDAFPLAVGRPPALLRLKKRSTFITRVHVADPRERPRRLMDRLLGAMAATGEPCLFQLALTPAPAWFEASAKGQYKRREQRLQAARDRGERRTPLERSQVESTELRGGLDIQHRPLFFAELRVVGAHRRQCEAIASELRAVGAENRLVERGTAIRQALLGIYDRRVARGEGNPLPGFHRGVYASTELATLWQLPSAAFLAVPLVRTALPVAPAPPAITRVSATRGLLRDASGTLTIAPELRRQNLAAPGAVEQGKSSLLVASVCEDLARNRCAVIVLDPKGDAADAAISAVPKDRVCTILDCAAPTCGFNPLAVAASPDTIADYVVAAMRNLFDEGDIRASSDRYLRNAIIAVLAYDRTSTLWDATRALSVTEEGYAYRARVGAHVRGLPEFKEIGDFFTEELRAQLRDAKAMTTSKLDAPVNKAARLLNSAALKRVLQNRSLTIDLDRVIAGGEVLIVKGALGRIGAGNTAVLMQLLVGMLDAALARQQDDVDATDRVAVALKIDEAPLVINRGFAQTMALKRSAGLETVACWQADAQWTDREVRDQLDALFAHRVYFATASVPDARAAAELMRSDLSHEISRTDRALPILGQADVRLHLPRHHALASWVTAEGRQPAFIATTLPIAVDGKRIAWHLARQAERGGRELDSFRQPHWDRDGAEPDASGGAPGPEARDETSPAAASRATHRSDPTGERERDDFAELRELLRVQAADRVGAAATARTTSDATPRPSSTGARTDKPAATAAPASQQRATAVGTPAPATPPAKASASHAPASYAELSSVADATRVSWPRKTEARPCNLDATDLELLAWLTELRFALATQIHRRFGNGRSYSTTQRRLKKLTQARLVERFQFFADSGASSPLVYLISAQGIAVVADVLGPYGPYLDPRREWTPPSTEDPAMRMARHDVRVTAATLALETPLGERLRRVRGPRNSYVAPPLRTVSGQRRAAGPDELRLPGGRTPHGFARTDRARQRVAVEQFAAIEPDATLELRIRTDQRIEILDVLLELDRTFRPAKNIDKFERYDHMISGWCALKDRYVKHCTAPPLVLFVCRDQPNAKEFCRAADPVVTAAHSYGGEYPGEWAYPGRERMLFIGEPDLHEGRLEAYALPALPPEVRALSSEDPRQARTCHPRLRGALSGLNGGRC